MLYYVLPTESNAIVTESSNVIKHAPHAPQCVKILTAINQALMHLEVWSSGN